MRKKDAEQARSLISNEADDQPLTLFQALPSLLVFAISYHPLPLSSLSFLAVL